MCKTVIDETGFLNFINVKRVMHAVYGFISSTIRNIQLRAWEIYLEAHSEIITDSGLGWLKVVDISETIEIQSRTKPGQQRVLQSVPTVAYSRQQFRRSGLRGRVGFRSIPRASYQVIIKITRRSFSSRTRLLLNS